jgi:hypothetical protein
MTERVGEEKQFLECSTSGFEFRPWQSRRARGKFVVLESRSALPGPPERRHWNTRNSGNNLKAHVEGLLKVEVDDFAIVSVNISLFRISRRREGSLLQPDLLLPPAHHCMDCHRTAGIACRTFSQSIDSGLTLVPWLWYLGKVNQRRRSHRMTLPATRSP